LPVGHCYDRDTVVQNRIRQGSKLSISSFICGRRGNPYIIVHDDDVDNKPTVRPLTVGQSHYDTQMRGAHSESYVQTCITDLYNM